MTDRDDTWGTKINENLAEIDALFRGSAGMTLVEALALLVYVRDPDVFRPDAFHGEVKVAFDLIRKTAQAVERRFTEHLS